MRAYSGERAARYAALKLSGLEQAPGHLAVFSESACETGHGLGRATMPETLDYSVVAAIVAAWLAARADGIGIGWVSILNPDRVREILDVPASWKFIGYLCVGYPEAECDSPELERARIGSAVSIGRRHGAPLAVTADCRAKKCRCGCAPDRS